MAKVMIFAGYGPSLLNFRGALLRGLVKRGHDVIGMSPHSEPHLVTVGEGHVSRPHTIQNLNIHLNHGAHLDLTVRTLDWAILDHLCFHNLGRIIGPQPWVDGKPHPTQASTPETFHVKSV